MDETMYLSERKAAAKVGVSRTTLRRHRAVGNITPLTFGGAVLYQLADLENWYDRFTSGRLQKGEKR